MSEVESAFLAGKDAAVKEREDRLENARKKLKKYRARQSKTSSVGSSVSSTASSRRDTSISASITSNQDGSAAAALASHRHRRSLSKSSLGGSANSNGSLAALKSHGRRASKSRASRGGSIGGVAAINGHSHNRSRASVSMAVISSPFGPLVGEDEDLNSNPPTPTWGPNFPASASTIASTSSWPHSSSSSSTATAIPETPSAPFSDFQSPPPPPQPTPSSSLPSDNSSTSNHTPNQPSLSVVPPPSQASASTNHGRRASRHNRRSSVANFRESLEVVSGSAQLGPSLQPAVSSFASAASAGTSPSDSPPSPSNTSRPVSPFPTDPAKVLEALKERGRRESELEGLDPEGVRLSALEALEGRVSAPSPMIDLGTEAEGELLVAPPSPGYTTGSPLPPASPSMAQYSPMVGLGLNGAAGAAAKRNSWSGGPVIAAGAKAAMELGVLAEEDEEEEEDEELGPLPSSAKSSPRRNRSRGNSPRKRPASLFLPPTSAQMIDAVAVSSPVDETPLTSSFAARPMRLSLSLSSNASSAGTPSTAASPMPPPTSASQPQQQRAPVLRSLTLGALPAPSSVPLQRSNSDEREKPPGSPGEQRRISMFHSVAVSAVNGTTPMTRVPSINSSTAPPTSKGLRPLSIAGAHGLEQPGATSPILDSARSRSPVPPSSTASTGSRRSASTSTNSGPRSATSKRSSISYRNTSVSTLASPADGPLLGRTAAWRTSMSSSPAGITPTSAVGGGGGFGFPFASSHGNMGGFGDLEVDEATQREMEDDVSSVALSSAGPLSDDPTTLQLQIGSLRTQNDQLRSQLSLLESTHALEIAEFEKKAGEEARGMRLRNSELERQLEGDKIARRFEVEGLSREVEQAREAIQDLTDERDSLREDVDGWRSRCQTLEYSAKQQREDDSLAAAQAKLIGEMRDQIYNLVAALERERGEHAESRQEIERLLQIQRRTAASSLHDDEVLEDEDDEEAAIGMRDNRHRGFQSASDGSVLSSFGRSYSGNTTEDTSINTDIDDSFSKMSSPPSGHSSFGQAIGFPAGSKRDSDFANSALHTLAEEDEEEDDLAKEAERIRLGSGSTASTEASEVLPLTPSKDAPPPPPHHERSDSFVRHWSFPKGSVSSNRVSVEDHTFFGLDRHASLPPLPLAESILPDFLTAGLEVDEEVFSPVRHARRPSSPRPLDRMVPHTRRFSGQYGKAPPVSPSALAHAAMASSAASTASTSSAPKSLSRFGSFIGSLGGWAPGQGAQTPISAPATKMSFSSTLETDDEEDVFLSNGRNHQTPPSLLHGSRPRQKYIKASQQPIPKASRLALLDFTPICCADQMVITL
ncbi:hypothetical protein T439DRAFT_351428 [Meredithblackwellia eburnea MCA 4105]